MRRMVGTGFCITCKPTIFCILPESTKELQLASSIVSFEMDENGSQKKNDECRI